MAFLHQLEPASLDTIYWKLVHTNVDIIATNVTMEGFRYTESMCLRSCMSLHFNRVMTVAVDVQVHVVGYKHLTANLSDVISGLVSMTLPYGKEKLFY